MEYNFLNNGKLVDNLKEVEFYVFIGVELYFKINKKCGIWCDVLKCRRGIWVL